MKKEVKVIIGANYGDEGKGLATSYFAEKARQENKKCLNVLFNGGCQRGHTVETEDGFRHVYSHFGCGSHYGADTYFDRNFMVNPVMFMREYRELQSMGEKMPKCYISPECRVITFYDMFINQIREHERGENRHGSCGHGIWETRRRYENGKFGLRFGELLKLTDASLCNYLMGIGSLYLPRRLLYCGVDWIPPTFRSHIDSEIMRNRYIDDFRQMAKIVEVADFMDTARDYDTIIFEGAQGLALDEDNIKEIPHTTASNTGSYIPRLRVSNMDCDVEECYVTRTYFTRHGAGKLPTECKKEDINPDIEDLTNNPNDFQGTIRYGKFDYSAFHERYCMNIASCAALNVKAKLSLFITHLNYTNGEIAGNITLDKLSNCFDKTYLSNSKYAKDVTVREQE